MGCVTLSTSIWGRMSQIVLDLSWLTCVPNLGSHDHVAILYSFCNIERHWSKTDNFSYVTAVGNLVWGDSSTPLKFHLNAFA